MKHIPSVVIVSCLFRTVATVALSLKLVSQTLAQDEPDANVGKPTETQKTNDGKLAEKWVYFMKKSVTDSEFLLGPDFKEKPTVDPAPLLRFINPVSGLQAVGFFVGMNAAGQPMVGAQILLTSE
jgi:hypothetical protein